MKKVEICYLVQPWDNLETVTNGHDKEVPKEIAKEIYIYPEKKNKKLLIICYSI